MIFGDLLVLFFDWVCESGFKLLQHPAATANISDHEMLELIYLTDFNINHIHTVSAESLEHYLHVGMIF